MDECKCKDCEMLMHNYPIKVIDARAIKKPHLQRIPHMQWYEEGYKCQYNGNESLWMEDLPQDNCRLVKG